MLIGNGQMGRRVCGVDLDVGCFAFGGKSKPENDKN
jgi:hypothetical protein